MRLGFALAAIFAAGTVAMACGADKPGSSITVKLDNYSVAANKVEAPAGKVTFTTTNVHATDVHELAVLRVKTDGSFDNLGEVEDLDPGKGGKITLSLKPGKYVLACLITIGQEGSTVDHFQAGMRQDFRVN